MTLSIVASALLESTLQAFLETAGAGDRRHVYSMGIDAVSVLVSGDLLLMRSYGYRSEGGFTAPYIVSLFP